MDTIFTRGPSLNNRLAIAVVMSVLLIIVDHKFDGFQSSRTYLNSLMSPLQYMANLPGMMLNLSAERLTSQQQLIQENERLTYRVLKMSERLQRFESLQNENYELRRLLKAPLKQEHERMVAELMSVETTPYSQQVLINKGTLDGAYVSQPILDDRGIVGQVMEVSTTNSRVLLVTDVLHAVPVRSLRNNIRFIASGTGTAGELILDHIPHSVDIQEGDVLVTSGLGNVFPEGYPVATVNRVVHDERRPFAQVTAVPMARLDRLKYLLMLGQATQAPQLNSPAEANND